MTTVDSSRHGVGATGRALGSGSRIGALDALRGLALCGIIFVNIPPVMHMSGIVDMRVLPVRHVLDMTVQQRFFPIFSLLFGVGFGIFLQRAGTRVGRPRLMLGRRLLALAVFGALHHVLQPGEALLVYAIVGMVFLLPLSWSPRWANLVVAAALLVAGVTVAGGGTALTPGLLVLGFAAAQYRVPEKLHRSGKTIFAVFAVSVVLSVVTLIWQEQDPLSAGFNTSSALAGLCMATAYVSGFLLFLPTAGGRALSRFLQPIGRMALTNYVTATLLFVPLGHLLGLHESTAWSVMLALAAGILVLQAVWSHVWLAHFRYGPMEWLWRCITWWRIVPMRTRPSA